MKRLFKIVLIFIISTIIIYSILTLNCFCKWCNENQYIMFGDLSKHSLTLDSGKIQELGSDIKLFSDLLEESLDETYYKNDSNYHSIAEYYDPLGYSVWSYFQNNINMISHKYITISILLGMGITIGYIIITCKKINNIGKLIIGYVGIMLIVPQIYSYSYTYRFFDLFHAYYVIPKVFYIVYTIIFILMYIINYKIAKKLTENLNQVVKKTKNN